MKRRIVITVAIVVAIVALIPLLTYEVIGVDFTVFMEDQESVGYQEGPRKLPDDEAVPLARQAHLDVAESLENPVPADEISVQRGQVLYDLHCSACHGKAGVGDGPVVDYWKPEARRPANLTEARFAAYPDGSFFRVIDQGIGAMPPLRENMDERQRWDVINTLRSFQER